MSKSLLLSVNVLCATLLAAQAAPPPPPAAQAKLSVHWEELTASDFKDAITRAQGTCLLPFFAQTQLDTPHDYVVYVQTVARSAPGEPAHKSDRSTDMHAGESETSVSMIARPDLVHLDRARQESGADQGRLKGLPEGLYTGIWWYARFPNHYAGEGAVASRELGDFEAKTWINSIVQAIRAVKADSESLRLQNEFYERSKHPLETPQ